MASPDSFITHSRDPWATALLVHLHDKLTCFHDNFTGDYQIQTIANCGSCRSCVHTIREVLSRLSCNFQFQRKNVSAACDTANVKKRQSPANHSKNRLPCRLLKCFRSLVDKQCRLRSDRSYRIWVHTVFLYVFAYSIIIGNICSRLHFQSLPCTQQTGFNNTKF